MCPKLVDENGRESSEKMPRPLPAVAAEKTQLVDMLIDPNFI